MRRRLLLPVAGGALLANIVGACNSGSDMMPAPSDTLTVTLSASGLSPATLTVGLGARVLFVNDDSKTHVIVSDPHPDEDDCPAINQVGFLLPGQRRETGNFVQAETCGFHDREAPASRLYAGTIVIEP